MTRGIRPDLSRRALGDDLAVVEDRDPVADAHDDAHVVLDEQDGQAQLGAELADEIGHLAGLAVVHAGGGFVEQEELRAGRRGPARSQAGVGRRRAGSSPTTRTACRDRPASSRPIASAIAACSSRSIFGVRRTESHQWLPRWTFRPTRTLSSTDMAPNSRMFWKVRPMPIAVTSCGFFERTLPLACGRERLVVECDLPGRRNVVPGDHVEERRLAGAVRPDERHDGAARDIEVDVVDSGQPAELLRHATRVHQGQGRVDVAGQQRRHG